MPEALKIHAVIRRVEDFSDLMAGFNESLFSHMFDVGEGTEAVDVNIKGACGLGPWLRLVSADAL